MKQHTPKKLELKKKAITRLNAAQLQQMEGGSFYNTISIIMVTNGCATFGCMTDFTRPRTISY